MKKTLTELKGEIFTSTVIIGHFNKIFSIMDRIARQKIYKETVNNSINQVDIIDKYRTLNTPR